MGVVCAVAVATAVAAAACVPWQPVTLPQPAPTSTPSPIAESGVEGQVLVGPTCPVENVASPCADKPASVALELSSAAANGGPGSGGTIFFKSGVDGRFRVAAPPGTYLLDRAPCPTASTSCVFPRITPQTVVVHPGQFTSVIVKGDTGIR